MQELGKNEKEYRKMKFFINNYNWKGIKFPSRKHDWKIFEKNNPTIALNVSGTKSQK